MEVVRKVVIPLAGGDDLVPAYAQERPVVLVVKLFLLFLQAVDERGTHVLAEGWVAGLPDLKPKHLHQRSEEHTSELQSLMRISYAVFCLKKKKHNNTQTKYR